ncbi:MAG: hypothetical protein ACI88C_003247, partial [Acidimicrobiales bacterium]
NLDAEAKKQPKRTIPPPTVIVPQKQGRLFS